MIEKIKGLGISSKELAELILKRISEKKTKTIIREVETASKKKVKITFVLVPEISKLKDLVACEFCRLHDICNNGLLKDPGKPEECDYTFNDYCLRVGDQNRSESDIISDDSLEGYIPDPDEVIKYIKAEYGTEEADKLIKDIKTPEEVIEISEAVVEEHSDKDYETKLLVKESGKFFLYETKKLIHVDPDNEEAEYDGYNSSANTIAKNDFIEIHHTSLINSDRYVIQGGHCGIDFIFGKIESSDKGSSFVEKLRSGEEIVYNKIGEVELKEGELLKTPVKYKYSRGVKFSGYSVGGEIKDGKLLGGDASFEDFSSNDNIIEDNLGAGIDIYAVSRDVAAVLLKRVVELPFQLCD